MRILTGYHDLFTMPNSHGTTNAICITTNGIIKKDGRAVMGAGVAKIANNLFHLDDKLAAHLRTNGNTVADLGMYTHQQSQYHILSFPTKEHWMESSNLDLIASSAKQLVTLCNASGYDRVYLTPPGCGCGGLSWKDVEPVLSPILDDRFTVLLRKNAI